jgi:hypothetical protein
MSEIKNHKNFYWFSENLLGSGGFSKVYRVINMVF